VTEADPALVALAAASDLQASAWERWGPTLTPPLTTLPAALPPEALAGMIHDWGKLQPEWQKQVERTREALERMWSQGVVSIPITDPRYPPQLRSIELPPLVLHVQGSLRHLSTGVAIVGSREPSERGQAIARSFSEKLAHLGIPIITGMARGTDQLAARHGAKAGGVVVGVVPGSPLDTIPLLCSDEYAMVRASGCIVSETTQAVEVTPRSFLRRNRIISGLARLLVVAATRTSGGTINQLEWAWRQQRPSIVFDRGAEPGFQQKVKKPAYHFVPEHRLVPLAEDLWTAPRMSPQTAL